MKIVVQRVLSAHVCIEDKKISEIEKGLLLLVGFCKTDTRIIVEKMTRKLLELRIFEDERKLMNLSILDLKQEILSVSQFTLYANTNKGRRPSFDQVMNSDQALILYNYFNDLLSKEVIVKVGIFKEYMQISLVNDGPVTIILNSEVNE